MIKKRQRKMIREAILRKQYEIPDCNKRKNNEMSDKQILAMDMFFKCDTYVPKFPWEMQL